MDIAGIDYSTHYVDIVRIREGEAPFWNRCPLDGADSFDRSRTVAEIVPGRASSWWDDVLAVGIEEPAGRNTGHLFRVQGAILSQIPARMLVEKWMPSQWRKAVGLPGNAAKGHVKNETMLDAIHKYGTMIDWGPPKRMRYPEWIDEWEQDAWDAYCIALATQKALDRQAVVSALPSDEFGLEEA